MFPGNGCEIHIGDYHDEHSVSLLETVENDTDPSSSFQTLQDQEGECSANSEAEVNDESDHGTAISLQQRALNYLVKIKEENRIPQRTVENIAFATSRLFQGALHNLKKSLT